MAFKIGFTADFTEEKSGAAERTAQPPSCEPRKSVVQVYFAEKNRTLAYYNDRFDLHRGDLVYVSGKLEGLLGRVMEVNYNFKIKISDYQCVIAVADTTVRGTFFMAGSHFVTFERAVLPRSQVIAWFKAPAKEEDAFVSGSDETSFFLDGLKTMPVQGEIAKRGYDYYMENRVRYLCLDGEKGYAIVAGSENYEVEFVYRGGQISRLTCSCFCGNTCKHEVATLLQLQETLALVEKNYAGEYGHSEYFAAIAKGILFAFAVDGKDNGSFSLS